MDVEIMTADLASEYIATDRIYSARETRAIVKKLLAENDMLERRIQQLLGSHSDSVGYYRNGLLAAIRALGR